MGPKKKQGKKGKGKQPAAKGRADGEGVPSWVPVAAGVLAGLGVLYVLYKVFFTEGCLCNKKKQPQYLCTLGPTPRSEGCECPCEEIREEKRRRDRRAIQNIQESECD